jgi:hypothetical protein
MTAMKLYLLAAVTVFALSSPSLAQNGSPEDTLNGATLGKSMPGYYAGVPYHRGATAAPVGASGAKPLGATRRTHGKHSRRHKRSKM